jgi:hypothetical protein
MDWNNVFRTRDPWLRCLYEDSNGNNGLRSLNGDQVTSDIAAAPAESWLQWRDFSKL